MCPGYAFFMPDIILIRCDGQLVGTFLALAWSPAVTGMWGQIACTFRFANTGIFYNA